MADELPSGDKAVYVFIEMVALGFVLYAIEEAFKSDPSWTKVGIAAICGLVCFWVGIKWSRLKSRIAFAWARRIDTIANDFRYRFGLPLLLVGIAAACATIYLQSIRNDLNAYIIPRHVTAEQSNKLRDYLSHHEASAVSVKAVRHDQEAMGYAGELFNAMHQTNWDVNPPNHDGPGYLSLQPYEKRPNPADVGSNRVHKNYDEYLNAYDKWVEAEIRRSIDENMYEAQGLYIQVEMPGQPVNPDPRHPTPESILGDAMRYAGIEVNGGGGSYNKEAYKLYLMIGHRPRVLGNQAPFLYKVGDKIEQVSRWFRRSAQ